MQTGQIRSWLDYMDVVPPGTPGDLKELGRYPGAILVTGCQRSGTTALADIIQSHKSIASAHSELEGAIALRGYRPPLPQGRHCFQTTYVSSSVDEYFAHIGDFKMVFVLRNPLSVVYSMANNWSRKTCHYVFQECGTRDLSTLHSWFYRIAAGTFLNNTRELTIRKAARTYNAKLKQLFDLAEVIAKEDLLVVEYDQLVQNKHVLLPRIYGFLALDYEQSFAELLHSKSIGKAAELSARRKRLIQSSCQQIYARALGYVQPEFQVAR